jgi:hypothetical protein
VIYIDFDLLRAALQFRSLMVKGLYDNEHLFVMNLVIKLEKGHGLWEVINKVLVAVKV